MEAKNPEKAGSLHAIDHELNQQVADKKIMQKKTLEMKYMKTILCILTTNPRTIGL